MASPRAVATPSAAGLWWRLVVGGLALELLFVLLFVAGGYLDWYPSRLGAPAAWIEDNVMSLARPLFVGPDGKLALVAGQTYLGALGLTFVVYALCLYWASRLGPGDGRMLAVVMAFSGLFAGSLLLQPYLASQDIFSYALYARILGVYGHNPYVDVPRDFPFDPIFGAIFWKDQPSNYGPVWIYLSALLARLSGPNVALTLASLKALSTAFTLASVPLVWGILGRISPRDRLLGTVFYAWNPLVVMETSGNGHNDSVMAFFLLLAVWLYARRRPTLATGALVLSALTKYVALVLLPFFVMVLLRQAPTLRERALLLVRHGLVTAILIVVSFLPVYRGLATFQVVSFGSNPLAYTNSPLELVFRELRVALGESRDFANMPLRYQGWWVESEDPTILWSQPDDPAATGVSLPSETPLLVVAPQRGPWLHVYEPRLDRYGYVDAGNLEQIPAPRGVAAAGAAAAVLHDANLSPTAQRANLILRGVTTSIFALAFAVLLWRVKSLASALRASLIVLFLSYWLIETWFWPWYVIWALVFAALLPRSRLTHLVVAFCLTTLVLNAQATVEMVPLISVAYEYRSVLIFGLPLAGALVWLGHKPLRRNRTLLALSGSLVDRLARSRVASWRRSWATPRALWIAAGLAAPALSVALVLAGLRVADSAAQPQAAPTRTSSYMAWQTEYQVGLKHLDAQEYPAAVDAFTRAMRIRPDIVDTYRRRALAYIELRRYDQAIADLTQVVTAGGEEADLLLARGDAYVRRQRFDLALRDYTRAVELDPADPLAHRGMARALAEQGDLDEALRAQRAAIALDPRYAPLYRELGDIYAARGEYEQALATYDQAVALDGTQAQVYVSRAAALKILGRPVETALDLERVLVLSNDADEWLWAQRSLVAMSVRIYGERAQP